MWPRDIWLLILSYADQQDLDVLYYIDRTIRFNWNLWRALLNNTYGMGTDKTTFKSFSYSPRKAYIRARSIYDREKHFIQAAHVSA